LETPNIPGWNALARSSSSMISGSNVRAGNSIPTIHIAGPTTSAQHGQAVCLARVLGGMDRVATSHEIGSIDILGLIKHAQQLTELAVRNAITRCTPF
jgi:hypothetical protein